MAIDSLAEFRAMVKSPEYSGMLIGSWSSRDNRPLVPLLKEIADDVARWFRPEQQWTLAGVNYGMISIPRIANSSASSTQEGENKPVLVAKRSEPDKFTPVFHFDSEHAPLTGNRFSNRVGRKIHVYNIFSPDFRYKHVLVKSLTDNIVFVDHVGPIKEIGKALEDLSPYYLLGVQVSANHRYDPLTESSRSISVMVHARDLGDHLKLEQLKFRRMSDRFEKKFANPQAISPQTNS